MSERGRHLLMIVAATLLCACAEPPERAPAASTGIRFLAGIGAAAGFDRASEIRSFAFPADHGAHASFQTEWWYFTGTLSSRDERRFGFELTFFRYALAPAAIARESPWATRQIWMAHLALTDVSRSRFLAAERVSREALGLAGARNDRFAVWVEDWTASQTDPGTPIRLAGSTSEFGIDLELDPTKPIVLQGNAGLDAKGPEPGNASYYYSWPGLAVSGEVHPAGEAAVDVTGLAWLDREWSTSSLSPGVVGWDWFALQLSDGRDLMFYRMRDARGEATAYSGGSLTADGTTVRLDARSVTLEPREWWESPRTGVRYPIAWRLRSREHGLDLLVDAWLPNQEVDLSVRYWEGAVGVTSTNAAPPISGTGYLELAGYAPESSVGKAGIIRDRPEERAVVASDDVVGAWRSEE